MKTLAALFASYLSSGRLRGNLRMLARLLLLLLVMVIAYSAIFHALMAWEGRSHSWTTAFYWTIVTMSTLGFGDITFQSDLGRFFSVIVVISGTVFLLILLPFTFIQFFYAPWLEARDAARAPRELADDLHGHVLLTAAGPIDFALIGRLNQFRTPYVVIVPDVAEALRLHDMGIWVMVGDLDDPATYRRARAPRALLVAATQSDPVNTNIAVTVREAAPDVPIVATATSPESVDILQLAGCQEALEVGQLLGRFMARRIFAGDGRSHVIGQIDALLIAEAWAARTALVGKTLRELNLRGTLGVTVGGVWQRGKFGLGGPGTTITPESILLLAGTREQLDNYDRQFGVTAPRPAFVVIIGGGRVGLAASRAIEEQGVDYRIVEKTSRLGAHPRVVVGDAADLDVLNEAGIGRASCAIVTTHDDDVNVYLTLYCRRLRPDMLVVSRATRERNTTTLHRAGADFVLSYASIGANAIFNTMKDRRVLLVAEGLDVFTVPVPRDLVGRTLIDSGLREETGCNLLAIRQQDRMTINPPATLPMPAGSKLILIGDREAEGRFFARYRS
jgi:Trk K+ transport system NAD-binding subunit